MRSLVAFLFICMVLPKAAPGNLSCYSCDPPKCEKYGSQTCPPWFSNCLTGSATLFDKKVILKICATNQMCDGTKELLRESTVKNIHCCQENLCNGAERFTLSFLLMFIPLIFSILFY